MKLLYDDEQFEVVFNEVAKVLGLTEQVTIRPSQHPFVSGRVREASETFFIDTVKEAITEAAQTGKSQLVPINTIDTSIDDSTAQERIFHWLGLFIKKNSDGYIIMQYFDSFGFKDSLDNLPADLKKLVNHLSEIPQLLQRGKQQIMAAFDESLAELKSDGDPMDRAIETAKQRLGIHKETKDLTDDETMRVSGLASQIVTNETFGRAANEIVSNLGFGSMARAAASPYALTSSSSSTTPIATMRQDVEQLMARVKAQLSRSIQFVGPIRADNKRLQDNGSACAKLVINGFMQFHRGESVESCCLGRIDGTLQDTVEVAFDSFYRRATAQGMQIEEVSEEKEVAADPESGNSADENTEATTQAQAAEFARRQSVFEESRKRKGWEPGERCAVAARQGLNDGHGGEPPTPSA